MREGRRDRNREAALGTDGLGWGMERVAKSSVLIVGAGALVIVALDGATCRGQEATGLYNRSGVSNAA